MICYPSEQAVREAVSRDEPMLALISFGGDECIVSPADDAVEHHILLAKAGRPDTDIDRYFRIVFDQSGADWTFVCPPDYRGIASKERRIEAFYKDGFSEISNFLHSMGYLVGISIPKRYRRHLDMLGDNTLLR
jgi:hypothetical protein